MAFAALKSLGPPLAGAKKALRKLFGRVLPAARGDEATNNGSGPASPPSSSLSADLASSGNNQIVTTTANEKKNQKQNAIDIDMTPIISKSNADDTAAMAPAGILPLPHRPLLDDEDKENRPSVDAIAHELAGLKLAQANGLTAPPTATPTATTTPKPAVPTLEDLDPAVLAEREQHLRFIEEALNMARLALHTNETPVGCVLVHDGKVIAKGMNATNVTRNGTRHAEFMAISALLSYPPGNGRRTTFLRPKQPLLKQEQQPRPLPQPQHDGSDAGSDAASVESEYRPPDEGNEDGSKGHLYPYGQKLHPAPRVDRRIIRESILYVTVEPCVMCASLLRQLGIKKVYFGAANDKFGGTGGVFSIHANSLPIGADGQTASAHPTPKPIQFPDGGGSLGTSFPPGGGDGGNVENGYEIEGGWGRDQAVSLLRRFYVQENGRAPVPRKKEGRAARLAAMMERDGNDSAEQEQEQDAAEERDETGEIDLDEFNSPDKENVDPDGDLKSRSGVSNSVNGSSGGLREKEPLANADAILREAANY